MQIFCSLLCSFFAAFLQLFFAAARRGAAEEIALAVGNPETLKRFEFFAGLDAFGDDLAAELAGHGVECAQEFLPWRIGVDPSDQREIDLDEVWSEFHDRFEASVGDTRIVERNLEAEFLVVVPGSAQRGAAAETLELEDQTGFFRPLKESIRRMQF